VLYVSVEKRIRRNQNRKKNKNLKKLKKMFLWKSIFNRKKEKKNILKELNE
jgi:hypothetical protein